MRYQSIDVLRTLAIFLMVLVHFLENLSGVAWAPAGLGAPMFGFLVGVSHQLWLNGQLKRDKTDEEIDRSTTRRGLFIFTLGILFNILVWLPADTFNWDVLTLIGTAFIVLRFVRNLPDIVPLSICVVLFVASPFLRIQSGYHEYWLQGYFDPDWTFSQILMGYLVNGYFPLFPWLIFPLLGSVVGKRIVPEDSEWKLTWSILKPITFIGIGMITISVLLRLTRPYQTGTSFNQLLGGWTMFPPSVEYMTGMIGVEMVVFCLAIWWIDQKQKLSRYPRMLGFCQIMSRYSFSAYIIHHLLHVWPLWVVGYFSTNPTIYYWRLAMSWEWAMLLIIPCIALMYWFFCWIDRRQIPLFETWLRRYSDR